MSAWADERPELLRALQDIGASGRAEGARKDSLALGFYPVAEHLRLLDPDVVLVVGPRGSGKTEIARVLTDAGLHGAVARHVPRVRLAPSGRWLRGYPSDREGFEAVGLRTFITSHGAEGEREVWCAYLVRTLARLLTPEDCEPLRDLLDLPGADVVGIYQAFRGLGTKPVIALDRLDSRLESEGHHVFVTYDELDTLGSGDWELIKAGVRGLVAFWSAYSRRWRAIRAKLFLRSDLYERHARAGGADLAKLAAGRVDLVWNERDLCGLLLKRLANMDPGLGAFVRKARGVSWSEDPELGKIPVLSTWRDARPVVELIAGEYMGADEKKGLAFRWVVDHVRDGLARMSPRPFLRLFEEAARLELQQLRPIKAKRLLEPWSLRRALDRVSGDHFVQGLDEWPWLETVKAKLAGALVPWERERDVAEALSNFGGGPSAPPLEGRDLVDYLIVLGILRRRADGRLDAPDLFLTGLGLKRKGGVRKRQVGTR